MMRVIEAYTHNRDVAQDILHDGFIIAFSSLVNLNRPGKFESWLTTIMRNLSLQYLRDKANHTQVPLSDAYSDSVLEDEGSESYLSWNELDRIIDRLPDGYGKVFRLAVLDGLSHKEIGERLGIAPHSSSSQLSHAKAMLRRLITEYRVGIIGIFTIILTSILVWLGLSRQPETGGTKLITHSPNQDIRHEKSGQPTEETASENDTVSSPSKIRYKIEPQLKENIAEVTLPADTITPMPEDSVATDSINGLPNIPAIGNTESLAADDTPTGEDIQRDWSLALAYNGNIGHNSSYRSQTPGDVTSPDPDLPSGDPEDPDIAEKSRHYMPLIIGISLNKSLSDRWSIESGIRYSFLRSDFLRESEQETTETIQRIHYIGIPVRLNYRITGNTRFTLYGQGGATLDIPVHGTQSSTKRWMLDAPTFNKLNVSAPLQWSVEGGLGIQYHITPSFSIYAEPSFRYYFNPGSDIRTIRQDRPFELTIPIGIRIHL